MHIILRRLKELTEFIFAAFYVLFLYLSNKKPRRVVIYYHSIKKDDVIGFRKQMAYLAEKCSVVKPSRITTARADGAQFLVAITFDDAFVSVLENAVPVLKAFGLPVGISVPTGSLGSSPQWSIDDDCPDKNELIVSEQQVLELAKQGFEILSHTVSHRTLTELDDDGLRSEQADSKRAIEKIIGQEVLGISYPHGAYNAKVCEVAEDTGYQLGFTIKPCTVDCSPSDLAIGRFSVSAGDSLIKFKFKVRGAYQVANYLRATKRLLLQNFK